MEPKVIVVLLITINCYSSCGAALRRTPKVYNALITTGENLTSSRAFPVIQPTIHENGIAHYPFGPYSPYGYYSPPLLRFGQPLVPGFPPPRGQPSLPYPLPQSHFPPQLMPHPPSNVEPQQLPGAAVPIEATQSTEKDAAPHDPPALSAEAQQPVKPPSELPSAQAPIYIPPFTDNRPEQMPSEKLPIPLNEFGLPPALIPLQQYPHRQGSSGSLPPYSFNPYPLIYDPVTGFREQFLPPYNYYPSHHNAFAMSKKPVPQTAATATPSLITTPQELTTIGEPEVSDSTPYTTSSPSEESDLESITNAAMTKNSAVPDVPPPPIPTDTKPESS